MQSYISIHWKLLFGLLLSLMKTFANTCSTICPLQSPFYSLSIDDESNDYYLTIQTSNCPPYAWDNQETPNTPCYKPAWWYVPQVPQFLDQPDYIDLSNPLSGPIGVLLNGVLLYGPADSLGRDAMVSELNYMDDCMSLTDGDGVHYTRGLFVYFNGIVRTYNPARCGLPEDTNSVVHSSSFGWMWDGYEIFGRYNGRYENIDFDDCGGHEHPVVSYGEVIEQTVYHYHMTQDFPYSIKCFKGCPEQRNNDEISRTCVFEAKLRPTLMPTLSPSIIPTPAPTNEGLNLPLNLTMNMIIMIASGVVILCVLCFILMFLIRRRRRRSRGYYLRTRVQEWPQQKAWKQEPTFTSSQRPPAGVQPTFTSLQRPPTFSQKLPQNQGPSFQASTRIPPNTVQYSQPYPMQYPPGVVGLIPGPQPWAGQARPYTQIVAPPCPFRR